MTDQMIKRLQARMRHDEPGLAVALNGYFATDRFKEVLDDLEDLDHDELYGEVTQDFAYWLVDGGEA